MHKRLISFLLCLFLFFGVLIIEIPSTHALSEMKTSDAGVKYIKSVEGFGKYPYYDYGQYTVGYGTKCPGNKYSYYKENGIKEEEAQELLEEHLVYVEADLNKKLIDKYNVSLTQEQFDALVSFSFNVGTGWITSKNNTMRSAIVGGSDPDEILYAFSLYCKAGGSVHPGLVTRRLCEANMYLNGVYSNTVNSDFGYVYYDANGGNVTYQIQGFNVNNNQSPALSASYDTHEFMGWYTEASGGKKIETLTGDLVGKTLFAHWDTEEGLQINEIPPIEVKVTGEWVNLREGPGTSYEKVGKAYANESFIILRVVNTTNMLWGQFDGGWICLDYTNYNDAISGKDTEDSEKEVEKEEGSSLEKEPEQQEDNKNIVESMNGTVKVEDALRIRSGPGMIYSTVGYLRNGDRVEVNVKEIVGETTWGCIGENKWVSMTYVVLDENVETKREEDEKNTESADTNENVNGDSVETTETTEPTAPSEPEQNESNETTEPSVPDPTVPETMDPDNKQKDDQNHEDSNTIIGRVSVNDVLRVRTGPGTTCCIVGYLYNATKVEIYEQKIVDGMNWGRISKGWISMNYVSVNDSNEQTEATTRTVTADCLRIRQDAGTIYKTVGYLYNGDQVEILEEKEVGGVMWGRIDKGWISLRYAQ